MKIGVRLRNAGIALAVDFFGKIFPLLSREMIQVPEILTTERCEKG